MSLEQNIKDLTAALIANTAALIASAPAGSSRPPVSVAAPKTPPATPATPELVAAAAAAVAAAPLTYEVVAKVVSDFVKANGRAPAVILLEPFKVTTLVPLKDKPAELAGVHAAFTDPVKTAAAKALAIANAAAAAAAAKPA